MDNTTSLLLKYLHNLTDSSIK